jgi:hypothetical protein
MTRYAPGFEDAGCRLMATKRPVLGRTSGVVRGCCSADHYDQRIFRSITTSEACRDTETGTVVAVKRLRRHSDWFDSETSLNDSIL